jgi:hypothetical protein
MALALELCAGSVVRSDPSPGRVALATTSRWQGLIGCSAQDSAGSGARSTLYSFA